MGATTERKFSDVIGGYAEAILHKSRLAVSVSALRAGPQTPETKRALWDAEDALADAERRSALAERELAAYCQRKSARKKEAAERGGQETGCIQHSTSLAGWQ
jgi:hypothetical protein